MRYQLFDNTNGYVVKEYWTERSVMRDFNTFKFEFPDNSYIVIQPIHITFIQDAEIFLRKFVKSIQNRK